MLCVAARPAVVLALAAAVLAAPSLAYSQEEEEERIVRGLERGGESFLLTVDPAVPRAMLSSPVGGVVYITPGAGNFEVRLPNGWGGWRSTMGEAVEYAVTLCQEARRQLTADDVSRQMVVYALGLEPASDRSLYASAQDGLAQPD